MPIRFLPYCDSINGRLGLVDGEPNKIDDDGIAVGSALYGARAWREKGPLAFHSAARRVRAQHPASAPAHCWMRTAQETDLFQ